MISKLKADFFPFALYALQAIQYTLNLFVKKYKLKMSLKKLYITSKGKLIGLTIKQIKKISQQTTDIHNNIKNMITNYK